MQTPGESAYTVWMLSFGAEPEDFLTLPESDKQRWNAVADAVIKSVKLEIEDEMVKAIVTIEAQSKPQRN